MYVTIGGFISLCVRLEKSLFWWPKKALRLIILQIVLGSTLVLWLPTPVQAGQCTSSVSEVGTRKDQLNQLIREIVKQQPLVRSKKWCSQSGGCEPLSYQLFHFLKSKAKSPLELVWVTYPESFIINGHEYFGGTSHAFIVDKGQKPGDPEIIIDPTWKQFFVIPDVLQKSDIFVGTSKELLEILEDFGDFVDPRVFRADDAITELGMTEYGELTWGLNAQSKYRNTPPLKWWHKTMEQNGVKSQDLL